MTTHRRATPRGAIDYAATLATICFFENFGNPGVNKGFILND
jgi:hypothetical protein